MFKRKGKRNSRYDLMNISARRISTGQMGALIKHLHVEYGFQHLGYAYDYGRFYIYAPSATMNTTSIDQFFSDRNPGMIEDLTRSLSPIPHRFNRWVDGYEEVVFDTELISVKRRSELVVGDKIITMGFNGAASGVPTEITDIDRMFGIIGMGPHACAYNHVQDAHMYINDKEEKIKIIADDENIIPPSYPEIPGPQYKIEVLLTPHMWDNFEKPYFWVVYKLGCGRWYNDGHGWEASVEEAFTSANKYFINKMNNVGKGVNNG